MEEIRKVPIPEAHHEIKAVLLNILITVNQLVDAINKIRAAERMPEEEE